MKRTLLALGMALGLAIPLAEAQTEITYLNLIQRLTDLEYLATLPAQGETCAQCSSYDRSSQYDAASGKYIGWDANGDGQGIIRMEDGKAVMAEMQGPGCIRRIWSAAPGDGHVRIYLDGSTEPVVDLPFRGYFDNTNAPFNRNALCYESAKGWNCYVPIPYRKSCKVVADEGWGNYFHFTYTTFPKGTEVPTFKRDLSPEENAALDSANQALANAATFPEQSGAAVKTLEAGAPASTNELALTGPAAITLIRARVEGLPPTPDDRVPLRELTLSITWDDDTEPSVWAPIGDFFGTAAGANTYVSLPSGLTKEGWYYSRWYMPFAKKAVIRVINEGSTEHKVTLEVMHAPLSKPVETLARFHAKWHLDQLLPEEPERAIDWTLLKTQGRGRFCGVMLHVWNPRGGWWGEGDEKFFVDGEKFPSTIGTGSEDYFGYAWCCPTLFTRPYHNQPISENNAGHTCVNRWHINDNIPFQTSFEGCIEKYFPNKKPTLYDATAYWYLAPGGTDPYGVVPMAERTNWPQPEVKTIKGAIEAEKCKVLSKTGGETQEQAMDGYGDAWSSGAQLWWTGAKPGDKLELGVGVREEGAYKLFAQFTKAVDYSMVQLYLDGEKLGAPLDLFHEGVVPSGEIDLGAHTLDPRIHRVTFEITGANPKAHPAHMVGIDYFRLEPVAK